MACGGFFNGNAGDVFRFQVTQDNDEGILTGSLTEFHRTTNGIGKNSFTKSQLLAGIQVPLAAGCSYHFEILKSPTSTTIDITITRPDGSQVVDQCTGKFLGPWIIRST